VDADPPEERGRLHRPGSNRQAHRLGSTGVVGTACRESGLSEWGNSSPSGGKTPTFSFGERLGGDSERVIVPRKPGNAGGGKDPHFRNA